MHSNKHTYDYILHNRIGFKILKPGNYWHLLFTRPFPLSARYTAKDRDTFTQIQIQIPIKHSNRL